MLAQTALPGATAAEFLRNAVAFCNETLHGTLGAAILIHPRTIRELGGAFDDALAALRYGCVTVNTWPGVGFTLATATWGAFPGNTLADVGSGIGIVHNAYLFDKPQKTVVRAPFAPFPRSLLNGERTLLPGPAVVRDAPPRGLSGPKHLRIRRETVAATNGRDCVSGDAIVSSAYLGLRPKSHRSEPRSG